MKRHEIDRTSEVRMRKLYKDLNRSCVEAVFSGNNAEKFDDDELLKKIFGEKGVPCRNEDELPPLKGATFSISDMNPSDFKLNPKGFIPKKRK